MSTLYKFVGGRATVSAMAHGSLKFTEVAKLNGPSELVEHMDRIAIRASLDKIRAGGYTQEQFDWLGCQEALLRLLSPETRILERPQNIYQANRTFCFPVYDVWTSWSGSC